MKDTIKVRVDKDANYKAIYLNGKTMRLTLDPKKPIKDLAYPEFFDVKITNHCEGNCPYCYMDAQEKFGHDLDIIEKINTYFGKMTPNQKPFQVALGGGEPTSHPQFIQILKAFADIDITPNYTTNGMHMSDELVQASKQYSEGVAISTHPHLEKYWTNAADQFSKAGIKTMLHVIISDEKSIDLFFKQFKEWKDRIAYFVLLPHMEQGRACHIDIAHKYLLDNIDDPTQIAFGANFFEMLKPYQSAFNLSLYEPEIMSKYLDMTTGNIYKSSFNVNNPQENIYA